MRSIAANPFLNSSRKPLEFIFTFKDDSLKFLWKKINNSKLLTQEQTIKKLPPSKWLIDKFSWINELRYKDQQVLFITYQQCEDQQIALLTCG